MGKSVEEMVLVGYHHFSSKDKSQIFYVVQVLHNITDIERCNNKATMINIFTTDDIYKEICKMSVGQVLKVEVAPNLETGKIHYKVVL